MTENERERLFRAFIAGWQTSHEGYNGECDCRFGEDTRKREAGMREEFDLWVQNRGLSPVGG